MFRYTDYLYIIATIALTAYGQIIFKWRVSSLQLIPASIVGKFKIFIPFLFDPAILSVFIATFFASFFWMIVMSKFDLSKAYPLLSLNFVAVPLLSYWLFNEPITPNKLSGIVFIILGMFCIAAG